MAEQQKWRPEVIETADVPEHSAAVGMLALGLRALSQRAIVALESLFTLVTVVLVFWVFMSIPEPTTHQIVAEAIFAAFVLAANVIVRRIKP